MEHTNGNRILPPDTWPGMMGCPTDATEADGEECNPFLYGPQYDRTPTPDREHWADDLHRMAEAGPNAVKLWAR